MLLISAGCKNNLQHLDKHQRRLDSMQRDVGVGRGSGLHKYGTRATAKAVTESESFPDRNRSFKHRRPFKIADSHYGGRNHYVHICPHQLWGSAALGRNFSLLLSSSWIKDPHFSNCCVKPSRGFQWRRWPASRWDIYGINWKQMTVKSWNKSFHHSLNGISTFMEWKWKTAK